MDYSPLNQLKKNQIFQIHAIVENREFGQLDDVVVRRLKDLGFGVGQTVEIIGHGVFGIGPYAVRLGNQSQFTLRRAEAKKIICMPI